MKKITSLIVITIALTGCAMFPQSESELGTNGNKSSPMCFSKDKAFVERRIKDYLGKCFKPTFVSVSATTGYNLNYYVDEIISEDSTAYNVYSPSGSSKGYFLNVKVHDRNVSCPTTVDITVFNYFWEKNFTKIKDSIDGETASCPM
jgi:hypothetical protein